MTRRETEEERRLARKAYMKKYNAARKRARSVEQEESLRAYRKEHNARQKHRIANDPEYREQRNRKERERRAENHERTLEVARRHRATNPEKVNAAQRKYSRKLLPVPTRPCPAVCECCGGPPGRRAMHLDHCHRERAFRGWLCGKCNMAIGLLGDTLAGAQAAVKYLTKTGA